MTARRIDRSASIRRRFVVDAVDSFCGDVEAGSEHRAAITPVVRPAACGAPNPRLEAEIASEVLRRAPGARQSVQNLHGRVTHTRRVMPCSTRK
jgi:hypothetical protein